MTSPTITLNGQTRTLAGPTPLTDLLASLELDGKPVVVELDGEALPRSAHATATVHPGATLEIITLAAGG